MGPIEVGLISFVALFVLLGFGVPIGITMGLVGIAGYWYLVSFNSAIAIAAINPFDTAASYDLSTLPLFILMAQVCFASGLGTDLYNLAGKWLGRRPGGLAMATVGASAGFGAVSASSVATAATIGLVAIPEMKKHKYSDALITGSVVSGGTLGVLIPPSSLFIYYGILTETSITKLFLAGIIPGILLALFYMFSISLVCWRFPQLGPQGPRTSLKEKIAAFAGCVEVIGLIALVLGGLIIGWFTPTEAGAVGATGAILLATARGRLSWQAFTKALVDTMKTTGMIYAILIGVMIFTPFMAITNLPLWLSGFITSLGISPIAVMVVIVLIYLFLGVVMDEIAMLFITTPIIFPLVAGLGFDSIWFGVLLVVLMMTATISPPLGINMYVIAGIAKDVPMSTIYRGSVLFMIPNMVLIVLLLAFPTIALLLPNLLK